MTGAELGTFLVCRSTNGAVFDRSDPRTTTAPQPSTIMKPVRTPWKGSGPVFNDSVDSWVALANPVPLVQRESAFHKSPGWFGPGISLDPGPRMLTSGENACVEDVSWRVAPRGVGKISRREWAASKHSPPTGGTHAYVQDRRHGGDGIGPEVVEAGVQVLGSAPSGMAVSPWTSRTSTGVRTITGSMA